MWRVTPLLGLLLACATPRAEKLSFGEVYAPPPASQPVLAQDSLAPGGLSSSLALFVEASHRYREYVPRGGPLPLGQETNWRRINSEVDAFLRRPAGTTPLDALARARSTLEAELELDARAYGNFPPALAEGIFSRVTQLAVRRVELRNASQRAASAAASLVFIWPVEPTSVTSFFGRRTHPITRQFRSHQGIDLVARRGQRVHAAAAGAVARVGWNGAHGLQVTVRHRDGTLTRYSHLSRALVKRGAAVAQGQPVGLAGATGRTTGAHLHFELWKGGRPRDPLGELGPQVTGAPAVARAPGGSSRARGRGSP